MIHNIAQYIDDDGRQVILKTELDSLKKEFFGTFQAPHPMGMGAIPVQFDFPDYEIENFKENLKKCFEQFDELAKTEYERMIEEFKDEQLKKQILTPEDTGGIILP
jgi:hypothetical protein